VNVGPSITRPIVPALDCYVTTPTMAAATQTARTSPPNSKMTSPKDSKGTLPVVTKTEGECPHQALPDAVRVQPCGASPLPFRPPSMARCCRRYYSLRAHHVIS
jgi:hypothetical protein